MLRTAFSILLSFTALCIFSQNISFSDSKTLLGFPGELRGFRGAVTPFDFNGDGITDLIRANDNIILYQGLGNDEYQEVENDLSDSNWFPVKSMDFDQDGDEDFIASRYILLNDGSGTFEEIRPSLGGIIVEAGDFNQDGLTDLISHRNSTSQFFDHELRLHYNLGENVFSTETLATDFGFGDLDIGDMDGDGDLDIVVLEYSDDFPFLILTNEGSDFTAQKTNHTLTLSHSSLHLIDLDGDEDLDIITNSPSAGLHMIENNEDLYFDNTLIFNSTPQIIYFTHGDLNNDGAEDIVFWGGNNSDAINTYVLQSRKDFSFEDQIVIGTFERPAALSYPNDNYIANNIAVYDYNQDGKLDILHTDGFSSLNEFVYIENTTIFSSTVNKVASPLVIYPNPVSNYALTVDGITENTSYFIYSEAGRLISRGTTAGNRLIINSIAKGLYFLRLEDLPAIQFSVK